MALSIFCSSAIYVVFKCIDIWNGRTFEAIVYNYITATCLGFGVIFLGSDTSFSMAMESVQKDWLVIAGIEGLLFISVFMCMALTAQKLSLTASSVASKMSMVIPISIFIVINEKDQASFLKITGIVLACLAVFLTTNRKDSQWDNSYWYLPVFLFFGSGIIDFLIGYAEFKYLDSSLKQKLFIPSIFLITGTIGVFILIYQYVSKKHPFNSRSLLGGIVLGIVNYGSLYFLIKALESPDLVQSSVFSINNMGIISLSGLFAYIFFKEKLSGMNLLGLVLGIISICIILVSAGHI
ncbi:MAG: EamA/RhaT family transporter [Bacteroidota bacterium]